MDKKESKELAFLREFSNISVASVCREINVDNSNLYKRGKNAEKIKNEIDKKIIKMYDNYINAGDDNE